MVPRIIPYSMASLSAKSLANHFGTKRLFTNGRYTPRDTDLLINWGVSDRISILNGRGRLLNKPESVLLASNKLAAFSKFAEHNINTLRFTQQSNVAKAWIEEGNVVYCRTLTRGSEGRGIVVAKTVGEVVSAPLYTMGIMNSKEYRVHVFNNNIIDIVRKKKMSEEKINELGLNSNNLSSEIRNLKKGWTFGRDGVNAPDSVKELSIKAVTALGLDFGAVDIIYNKDNRTPYVLEVNTAIGMKPGLTVHKAYVKAISELCGMRFDENGYVSRYGRPSGEDG